MPTVSPVSPVPTVPTVPLAAIAPPSPLRPIQPAPATLRPVPPPPPPRSTLPPLRPEPLADRRLVGLKPDAAMGSTAAGVRWKVQLKKVEEPAAGQGESDSTVRQDITRSVPSWLISMTIHLLLFVLLALLTSPVGQDFGRVFLTIGQSEGVKDAELTEFSIDQQSSLLDQMDASDAEIPVDVPLDLPVEIPVPVLNSSVTDSSAEVETPVPVDVGRGEPAIIPASPMVGGRSGAMKKTLLMLYGGTPYTESAVESGLAWLVKNQNKDGSWSLRGPYEDGGTSENKSAATAMALLAFMGAGNTHSVGEYHEVVSKGAKWLVKKQDRDGFFASDSRDHQQAYAQAQCSLAICELYAMSHDSWLREPAQKAIKCAEAWQAEEGGWRYQPGFDSDTSITGWFVMALQSGLAGGLAVDRAVLYRVTEYLNSVQSYDGAAYSYQPRGAVSEAMTAEGLLCRQYLGWPHNHPALVRGVDALSTEYNFNIDDSDFYYWYYATQVLHHYGGDPWKAWNNEMREKLPAIQVKRGKEAGSWAPQRDRWGSSTGRLYTTCMAIYCLEVYYRHMPLYKTRFDDKALPIEDSAIK